MLYNGLKFLLLIVSVRTMQGEWLLQRITLSLNLTLLSELHVFVLMFLDLDIIVMLGMVSVKDLLRLALFFLYAGQSFLLFRSSWCFSSSYFRYSWICLSINLLIRSYHWRLDSFCNTSFPYNKLWNLICKSSVIILALENRVLRGIINELTMSILEVESGLVLQSSLRGLIHY